MHFLNSEKNKALRSYSQSFGTERVLDRKLTPIREIHTSKNKDIVTDTKSIKLKINKYLSRFISNTSEEGQKQKQGRNTKQHLLRSFQKMKKKQQLSFSIKRKNKMLIQDQEESEKGSFKRENSLIVKEIKIQKEQLPNQQEEANLQKWMGKTPVNRVLALESNYFSKDNRRLNKRKLMFKNQVNTSFSKNKNIQNNFLQTRYPKIKQKADNFEKQQKFEPWKLDKDELDSITFQ